MRTTLPWILVLAAAAVHGQAPIFPNELVPLRGQSPTTGIVTLTKGVLADGDGDGDADAFGITASQGPATFVYVPAVGGTFPATGAAYTGWFNGAAIVAADVDGDGDRDAVVLSGNLAQLWTYFNDGTGGFTAPPLVRTLSAAYTAFRVVRLNADAIPDLVLETSAGGVASLLAGLPGGAYGPEIALPVAMTTAMAFADDDADGDDDLHFVPAGGGTLLTMRNNGSGTFAPAGVSATLNPSVVRPAFADVNGDGFLDAVVGGPPSNPPTLQQTMVQVAFGSPAGSFTAGPVQVLANVMSSLPPLLADFDGDGDPDLVACQPVFGPANILVAVNDGAGNFGPAEAIDLVTGLGSGGPASLSAGDVNGDALNDLGVFLGGSIVVLRSLGAAGLLRPKLVPVGAYPFMFRVADLNRDGKPDGITAIGLTPATSLSVVLDLDSGAPPAITPVGAPIQDLALGDWNRDGVLDLILAEGAPVNGLGVYLGDGLGGFGPPSIVPTGAPPVRIKPADANGDGNLDLLVLDSQVRFFPGNGSGAFGPPITTQVCAAGCINGALATGDLNGDGVIDILLTQYNGTTVIAVYFGAGNGSFMLAPGYPLATGGGYDPVLEDLNADGIPDFSQIGPGTPFGLALVVRLGLGGALFGPAVTTPFTPSPPTTGVDFAVGDVNGDGAPDAFASGGALLLNDGAGAFPAVTYSAVPYGFKVALADVNLDLQTDVILLQAAKDRFAILKNLSATTGTGFAFGLGCPGSGGFVPRLSAFGLPHPGGSLTVRVDRAFGGSPSAALYASPNPTLIPFAGGCALFVDPATLNFVPISLIGPPVAGAGRMSLTIPLPAVPGPIPAAVQAVIFDPASPLSYSGSNGMYFVVQ